MQNTTQEMLISIKLTGVNSMPVPSCDIKATALRHAIDMFFICDKSQTIDNIIIVTVRQKIHTNKLKFEYVLIDIILDR